MTARGCERGLSICSRMNTIDRAGRPAGKLSPCDQGRRGPSAPPFKCSAVQSVYRGGFFSARSRGRLLFKGTGSQTKRAQLWPAPPYAHLHFLRQLQNVSSSDSIWCLGVNSLELITFPLGVARRVSRASGTTWSKSVMPRGTAGTWHTDGEGAGRPGAPVLRSRSSIFRGEGHGAGLLPPPPPLPGLGTEKGRRAANYSGNPEQVEENVFALFSQSALR